MWLVRIGMLALAGALPVTGGCVCEQPSRARQAHASELAFYDFVERQEPSVLELWPASAKSPPRKRHQLAAQTQGADLVATNQGADPFLVWDFETPIHAGALTVDLFAA